MLPHLIGSTYIGVGPQAGASWKVKIEKISSSFIPPLSTELSSTVRQVGETGEVAGGGEGKARDEEKPGQYNSKLEDSCDHRWYIPVLCHFFCQEGNF